MNNSTDLNIDKNSYPTAGQLERNISQKVSALYRSQFGHQPSKVDCHLLGNKVVISLENVMTPVEKLLAQTHSSNLREQICNFVSETIKPKLQELIEEISQVNVTLCLYDTSVEADYAGAIVVLADAPQTRMSKSALKRRRY